MARPSKNQSRVVQCDGKLPFRQKQHAKLALRRTTARRRKLVVYRCPHCGFWHIGGESPK